MAKLFRKSLFGYKKKDVIKYVEEMSANFQVRLDECREEIDSLSKKREALELRKAEIDKEKLAISAAIVSAHEKAEKIIAEARDKSQKEYAEMQRKLTAENQKLVQIRREIFNIRRNAIKTLSNFEVESDDMENQDEI